MDENLNLNGNLEIEKALKEFEVKSNIEQVKQAAAISKTSNIPKIVQLVIKCSGGVIKEEKQAKYVLLGFVVVAIIISLFLVFRGGGSKAKIEAPAGQKVIYPENAPPRLEKQF
ncbi:MAG: hypothetical protein AAB902_01740, partial [Patescibacteria group bacterium]